MRYLTQHRGDWCVCDSGRVILNVGPTAHAKAMALEALMRDSSALTADAASDSLVPWESAPAIAFLNTPTSDRRVLQGQTTFRSMPLPVTAQLITNWGHDGAVVVGRVDQALVNGDDMVASGVLDTSTPEGLRYAQLVDTQQMDRVSIDYMPAKVELEVLEFDEDGWPTDWRELHIDNEVAGFCGVNVSAFGEAKIRLTGAITSAADAPADEAVAASAASDPPLEYFDDPNLPGRTRLTVGEPNADGHRRVFGHLAPWGECHIGILDKCVMAPKSPSNYAWFQLGTLRCAEGCEIPIGTIVMDSGHAPKGISPRATASYYDQTGWVVCDVTMGEDDHGIWYSGAVRPGVTDEQLRALKAARVSGDWRSVNGQLDLIAIAAVNTGGFPVYEEDVAADGHVASVQAALMEPAEAELMTSQGVHLLDARRLSQRVHR